MDTSYWRRQINSKPLFPDIEWNRPERKDQAGRLLIVGGNKLGFSAVADSYQTALDQGVGNVKVFLPDALKRTIPSTLLDVITAPSNPSGGFSKEALNDLKASAAWANGVLLIGDNGRNSETTILYEQFISEHAGPVTITRDAIDIVKNSPGLIVERPDTLIIASFAQLQKLFQNMYYPKMLTFSMQLLQLVEALHKFTLTYPSTLLTLHKDMLIIAHGGQIVTQEWDNPMAIWRGSVATRSAAYWLWNPDKPLEAVASSVAKS